MSGLATISTNSSAAWPALPFGEWADSCDTLHRWLQMVGKTRLALAPMENHWWNAALYLTARGLTTSAMPVGARELEVELDFVDHVLTMRTSDGTARTIVLRPRSVAEFWREYHEALDALGVHARIVARPVEMSDAVPFSDDEQHRSYDPDAAHRCWRALADGARVLHRFRSRWLGKCSPVHVWWGSFDLAHTRFSGRPAPRHPGGAPNCPDYVMVEAYSHECMSVGWWPGTGLGAPAFYAYAYPEPAGFASADVPREARYDTALREFVLPYDAVRSAADPDALVLDFAQRVYEAAATLGDWDRDHLERDAASVAGRTS